MALDVYFREDVYNILKSTHTAGGVDDALLQQIMEDPGFENVPVTKLVALYRQGFNRAILSVGIAFGLDGPEHGLGTRVRRWEGER